MYRLYLYSSILQGSFRLPEHTSQATACNYYFVCLTGHYWLLLRRDLIFTIYFICKRNRAPPTSKIIESKILEIIQQFTLCFSEISADCLSRFVFWQPASVCSSMYGLLTKKHVFKLQILLISRYQETGIAIRSVNKICLKANCIIC